MAKWLRNLNFKHKKTSASFSESINDNKIGKILKMHTHKMCVDKMHTLLLHIICTHIKYLLSLPTISILVKFVLIVSDLKI